jgi:hypothetical protein
MGITAASVVSDGVDSYETGQYLGRSVAAEVTPSVLLYYATVNHEQTALLRGIRAAVPPHTRVLGCSSQGVMTRGRVMEEGYAAGAIGIGGVDVATAHADRIDLDTNAKGRALGTALCAGLRGQPKVIVLFWDPLCGADMDQLLAGIHDQVRCPIIGGAAGQTHSAMFKTFQAFEDRVFERGAVAMAIAGDLTCEMACSSGTSPVGVEMTVTRAEGNRLLELDGRPALDVWMEVASSGPPSIDHTAALAIGVPIGGDRGEYLVRAAFGVDTERGAVIIQAGLPAGTIVMLHHRTVRDILDGTAAMARDLRARLGDKTIRAVLGFECGARTRPFLGPDVTARENAELQDVLGGATWLGMLAWGELFPVAGRPAFHNYTYPVLVLAD